MGETEQYTYASCACARARQEQSKRGHLFSPGASDPMSCSSFSLPHTQSHVQSAAPAMEGVEAQTLYFARTGKDLPLTDGFK